MKKKLLCLVLASAMILPAALGGCGNTKSTTNEGSKESQTVETTSTVAKEESKTAESTPESVPELEEATIQMMIIGPGPQEDTEKVMAAFNEMLQEYVPNTTVELTPVLTKEYKDTFNRMLATGEPVDLAWVGYTTNLNQDMIDGNLMPLDDLLNEYGQGIIEELGTDVLDMHRFSDGELYYTFSWQGLFANKTGFMFPKEFVELVEKTYPNWLEDTRKAVDYYWNEETTVDTLNLVLDQLEKYYEVLKANNKIYGGHNAFSQFEQFGFFDANEVYITGIKLNYDVCVLHGDETFTVVDIEKAGFRTAYYERMAEWYEKGYIPENILTGSFKQVTNGEWDESCAVVHHHNLKNESELKQYEASKGVELVGVEIQRKGSIGLGSATGMAIPYCADEPERAMMVLNALYTVPELYQLFVYGIEGEHYTYNDDGTINHVGLNNSTSPYGLANWFIGTCKNSLPESAAKISYYDELIEAEKDAYENPFVNFVFDETPVSDAVAALKAIIKEYRDALLVGAPESDWEALQKEYIAAREEAGVDRVIEEFQRQLDEYIKENNITGLWWD